MIKINDLKEGDIVMVDFDGQKTTGDVTEVSVGNKMAKVAHGEQEYWYEINDLYAVPISEDQLKELGFVVKQSENGNMLYERGPFSIQFLKKEQISIRTCITGTRHDISMIWSISTNSRITTMP